MRAPAFPGDFVRVSEISEYLFCHRSWYLKARGVRPTTTTSAIQVDRMRAGTERHHRHGLLVAFSQRLMTTATYVLIFALVVAAGYWFWTKSR
jgi:CRISPR/Cas system-associated exonuclease Cas4 (RecB family)